MINNLLRFQSINTDLASLFLRLIYGSLFVHYGYAKLISFDSILSQFPDIIGIGSKLSLSLVVFAELGCGLLIVIGYLTRFAVIPIFITMWVAYFIAHASDPFTAKTLAFVFLLLSVVIFILGSGKYSLDGKLNKT